MLFLNIQPPEGKSFEYCFEGESLVVGRSSRAGLTVPDPLLSREHARFFLEAGRWFIEDMKSRNGTFLYGEKLREPRPVAPGTSVSLGGTVVKILPEPSAPDLRPLGASDLGGRSFILSATDVLRESRLPPKAAETASGQALHHYAERLRILNEVHQALGRSVSLGELMELILDRIFEHLKPEEGSIYLVGGDGKLQRAAHRALSASPAGTFFSRTLASEVIGAGHAVLVQDALLDERFEEAASVVMAGVRSLIAAPLLDAEGALGMLTLSSKAAVRQFSEDDLELLVPLASVAALRIRNVTLAEEAAERRRLQHEIDLARKIQQALLPEKLPELPGYEIHAVNLPSRGASGDLYQVLLRNEGNECVLLVADVSGKGIGAALLTASLEALCAAPIEAGREPEEIFGRVSALLFKRTTPEKFATAFLAVLDMEVGRVRYANAGHNPALVLRGDGRLEELKTTGVPLGMFANMVYRSGALTLAPGDGLMLYTDGITEARDPEGEEYGDERLARLCLDHQAAGPRELVASLERDLDAFARGVPYADDRTLVVLKRDGDPQAPGGGCA